ncbi:efflux RND transporter permease subunit [Halobellus marinus]|uniref:efflux RND transporter permease subunit n=1 Tax=Halobellus TaxID=1073986 RepID=UPI0028AA8FC8|nr:MMPL family transporter [Halobellus sp. DFY28]
MTDQHGLVSAVSDGIVDHPLTIVVLFVLLTGGFATGIGEIQMEGGTEQFSEDVEAYQTNDYVDETFGPAFEDEPGTTLLLQDSQNVLSKQSLVRMLRVQHRLSERSSQRVLQTTSPAQLVAAELDPSATTTEAQLRVLRRATETEVQQAVRAQGANPKFTRLIGEDFNARSASSSAAIGVVTHDANGDDQFLQQIQLEAQRVATAADGDIRVFGSGITEYENTQVLRDSLAASIPAVVVLLVLFLAVAYRDPFDLLLAIVGLVMSLVWTFGFVGIAGIPFTQLQVALPPLLMAIGVDFGIHIINRYREELEDAPDTLSEAETGITAAVRRTISPLMVAFFMVMGTSVIGFSANMASGLSPIADFGLVAAVGIVSVMLIFGIFLPAAKLLVERLRRDTPLPSFTSKPLGAEDSMLGRVLPYHLSITSKAPVLFVFVLVLTAGAAGYYGQDVESSFENEDMLPPEEISGYLNYLPAEMQPGTYTVTGNIHFLEENFETTDDDTVTIYLQGSFAEDYALESVYRGGEDPPSSFVTGESRQAEATSILTVIDKYARESPSFAALVERSDRTGNGVPDVNLDVIYEELLSSPYEEEALQYLTADYRETRVVYSVETDATDAAITTDAESVAETSFRHQATETGDVVVFQRVSDEVYNSAVTALLLALTLAVVFLTLTYYALERRPALGVVTLFPILVTVVFLVATMRFLDIPFNTLTATILSVTVGIGIDYSIHVVHRFVEEYDTRGNGLASARVTLQGTGGALFGTTLTTATAGIALYYLSITPILVQFGALIAFSVTYSFITSVVILPVVLVLWTRWESVRDAVQIGFIGGTPK